MNAAGSVAWLKASAYRLCAARNMPQPLAALGMESQVAMVKSELESPAPW